MQPDPTIPSPTDDPKPGIMPPLLPASEPPVSAGPSSGIAGSPPPLTSQPARSSSSGRKLLAVLLSLCLGSFLADAVLSLFEETSSLFFGIHLLSGTRGVMSFFATLMALLIYVLMGLTPMIPKRLFLPVTLFNLLVGLAAIPGFIYFYARIPQIAWVISCSQLIFGLGILYLIQGGFEFRWPLVEKIGLNRGGLAGRTFLCSCW